MCSGKEAPNRRRTAISPQVRCSGDAGTLRLHLNEVLCQFRPAYRTPTLETRHVEADCTGYDGDETPDHDRHKHTANAPGKLCHDEGGGLDKDIEQHPRRIRTQWKNAILFILKRSLAGPIGDLRNNRPSSPEPTSQDPITATRRERPTLRAHGLPAKEPREFRFI